MGIVFLFFSSIFLSSLSYNEPMSLVFSSLTLTPSLLRYGSLLPVERLSEELPSVMRLLDLLYHSCSLHLGDPTFAQRLFLLFPHAGVLPKETETILIQHVGLRAWERGSLLSLASSSGSFLLQ